MVETRYCEKKMTDVTFIGLGLMGSALAETAIKAGFDCTIWNRTAKKAEPLIEQGASYIPEVAKAISASPVTIVCVVGYDVSDSILQTDACLAALEGRTLVQLTSGSARQASEMAKWVDDAGAHYVDGGIESFPDGIGEDDSMIMVAGDRMGFSEAEPVLLTLAPILHDLGADPARASAMFSALLSGSFGLIFGVMHAVAICEATGITREQYLKVAKPVPRSDVDAVIDMVIKCDEDTLEETEAYLSVWNEALGQVVNTLGEHGCNAEFPALMQDMLNRAEKAGYGKHDISALIKMIRPGEQ
jgi:3-hydroxyisobutyrate dehydrogenase-like beta-hydroxyacid dehydrogenase